MPEPPSGNALVGAVVAQLEREVRTAAATLGLPVTASLRQALDDACARLRSLAAELERHGTSPDDVLDALTTYGGDLSEALVDAMRAAKARWAAGLGGSGPDVRTLPTSGACASPGSVAGRARAPDPQASCRGGADVHDG